MEGNLDYESIHDLRNTVIHEKRNGVRAAERDSSLQSNRSIADDLSILRKGEFVWSTVVINQHRAVLPSEQWKNLHLPPPPFDSPTKLTHGPSIALSIGFSRPHLIFLHSDPFDWW
jgi:hypothetical protein